MTATRAIAQLKAGTGGGIVLVDAAPPIPGTRFWAGLRHPPVRTALEAVLRVVLAGSTYDRVVVGTHVTRHVPSWKVSASTPVGTQPLLWLAKGELPRAPRSPAPAPGPFKSFDPARLETLQERVLRPELYRSKSCWVQLDALLQLMSEDRGGRTAWVVDGAWFVPPQAPTVIPELRQRIEEALKRPLRSDLVLLFPEGAGAGARLLAEEGLDHGGLRLELPPASPRSLVTLCPSAAPWSGVLAGEPAAAPPIKLLPECRFATGPVGPRRPSDPALVDLEFWSAIDLDGLERELREQVLGQDAVVGTLLTSLRSRRDSCRKALARGLAPQRCRDARFLPPIMGLFGAAGMGKTHIARIVCDALFGDKGHFEIIDMTDKELEGQTVGSSAKYQGGTSPTALMRYASRTGGLGVVFFDEINKASAPNGRSTLAEAWGKGLEIFQDRRFRPTNPALAPGDGFFYLANTVFLLAGNVCPPGQAVPESFRSLRDFGAPFSQRLGDRLWFAPLAEDQFDTTATAVLRLRALEIARLWYPQELSGLGKRLGQANVSEVLRQDLVSTFRARIEGETPSFRGMRKCAELLDEPIEQSLVRWLEAPNTELVL